MRYRGEHLFVYGTLLLPQIMHQVSGQRHFSSPARLHEYARYGIRGKPYPGIVSQQYASVAGLLYLNLKPAAWQRLDYYEDDYYQRQRVQVEVEAGDYLNAWSYVVPQPKSHILTTHDWSLLQFQQQHPQGFLRHLSSRRHY